MHGGAGDGSGGLAGRICFNAGDFLGSTWTDGAYAYNISFPSCLGLDLIAGPYQKFDGTTSNSATR